MKIFGNCDYAYLVTQHKHLNPTSKTTMNEVLHLEIFIDYSV